VYFGGSAVDTTVDSSSSDIVSNGGTAIGTTLNSGGYLFVISNGTVSDTQVSGGEIVSTGIVVYQPASGFTAYASSVSEVNLDGGRDYVLSGGTTISTTVDGGLEWVRGGTASFTTISNGGMEVVFGEGTTSFTTVSRGDAEVYGTAFNMTVDSGGRADLVGGLAVSMTVNSGASADLDGQAVDTTMNGDVFVGDRPISGTTSGTAVNSAGAEYVSSGGTTTGTIVISGGTEYVSSGGTAISTTVNKGGVEAVFSAGSATFTTVSSGGYLVVFPGATQSDPLLSGGQIVSTGAVVDQPNSGFTVYGSSVSEIIIGAGVTEYVLSGGTAATTTVSLGGIIDATDLGYAPGGTTRITVGDVLSVTLDGNIYTQQLAGDYTGEYFQLAPGDRGGTNSRWKKHPATAVGC
jgi:autotransporter passenger strand-loop-strand repeat protein